MIGYPDLPHVNAALNATSALLLLAGYFSIRRNRRRLHQALMIAALLSSALFLVAYLVYHAQAGSVRFQGQGWARTLYFAVLVSHSILAAAALPMILVTLARAWRTKFYLHKRIARWTFPVWLYVSATGVLVYLMLYRL